MDEESTLKTKKRQKQKEKESNMICLNPQCPFSKNRFFTPSNPHTKSDSCRIWFYSIDDLLIHNKSLITDLKHQKSGLLFDFIREPIESIKKLSSLKKLNWKHWISTMLQQVWSQMQSQIHQVQKIMIQEIQRHLENAKIYDDIVKVLSNGVNGESTSKDLTQLLMRSKFPPQPIQMFNPDIIQTLLISIKQSFNTTTDSLTNLQLQTISQTTSLISTSQKTSIEEQMKKLEIWMNEQSQNPFSKVQVLAATFGVIPNSYTVEGKIVGLECFLCRQNLTIVTQDNNKKNAKKIVTKMVLDHLITGHQKEVFTNYRKKITKTLIREFTIDQIIEEIKQGKHKRIEIIDRENAGTYVAEENGQFIFEVVSKRNISLARGNYVVAQSIAKDAADIVMSFIIKDLFNMKNLTIRLVTNDHFGTTIEEICEGLKYDFKVISRLKR